MKLTGNRCRCQACGEAFNSVSVFDRHRVGPWTDRGAARRCLPVVEMEARGWLRNSAGFWVERRREVARERIDRARRSGDLAEVVVRRARSPAGLLPTDPPQPATYVATPTTDAAQSEHVGALESA